MTIGKVVELVGESKSSWQDAVQVAVSEASKTIRNINGVEVANWTAQVSQGQIVGYRANVKVAFGVEAERH